MKQIVKQVTEKTVNRDSMYSGKFYTFTDTMVQKFADLIVQECLDIIETHPIPVGNSPAGEIACEMTYRSLQHICEEIKERFEIKDESI